MEPAVTLPLNQFNIKKLLLIMLGKMVKLNLFLTSLLDIQQGHCFGLNPMLDLLAHCIPNDKLDIVNVHVPDSISDGDIFDLYDIFGERLEQYYSFQNRLVDEEQHIEK